MNRTSAARSVWVLALLVLASMPAWADPVRSDEEAQTLVLALLAGRTPPLDIGTVREVGQSYEVEVVTPRGSLVDRLLVDRANGRIRSLYGQMPLSFQPAVRGMGIMGWRGGATGPIGGDGLP